MTAACLHLNGLVFLLPGFVIGALLALVIVLRRLWLDADDTSHALTDALNAQSEFMHERGIHWGWWDNLEPWEPSASGVADSNDQGYPESVTITQEAS